MIMAALNISIPELLNSERSLLIFLFVNVVLGGGAAALAGKAIASLWRPWWQVILYMLLLAIGVRFIHYAVFGSRFLSLHYYLVDAIVCVSAGLLFYRVERVNQMIRCYKWINERAGALRWRKREGFAAAP
jgi:hypothetical protein